MVAIDNAEVLRRLREVFPHLPANITALTLRLRINEPAHIECAFFPELEPERASDAIRGAKE
jgi:hypothetical protein